MGAAQTDTMERMMVVQGGSAGRNGQPTVESMLGTFLATANALQLLGAAKNTTEAGRGSTRMTQRVQWMDGRQGGIRLNRGAGTSKAELGDYT